MESLGFLILLMLWIPIWLVRRELAFRRSPDYWRRWGVVVTRPTALQARRHPIGAYMGVPIYGEVRFGGHEYVFDRVQSREWRCMIEGGELFLEPGLVYRMQDSLTWTPS